MEFLLYEPTKEARMPSELTKENVRIQKFKPKLFNLYSQYESDRSFRISLFRIYSDVLTRGNVKIYFALGENAQIKHSAYLIPANWKYAFLDEHEANIGPCNTVEEARGKGLYPHMINYIVRDNPDVKCYLMIRQENISSIRGAIKANFTITDKKVRQTKLLHRFVCDEENGKHGRVEDHDEIC